jgi:hypothetical protein
LEIGTEVRRRRAGSRPTDSGARRAAGGFCALAGVADVVVGLPIRRVVAAGLIAGVVVGRPNRRRGEQVGRSCGRYGHHLHLLLSLLQVLRRLPPAVVSETRSAFI